MSYMWSYFYRLPYTPVKLLANKKSMHENFPSCLNNQEETSYIFKEILQMQFKKN